MSYVPSNTIIHNLAIPGDFDTGVTTSAGVARFNQVHGGTVRIDAGRSVIAADRSILMEAGQHHFDDYYVFAGTSALQPLCDAL